MLITNALLTWMIKAPRMGMTAKAIADGPCSWVTAAILAIAVGVAPIDEPIYPAEITAEA